MEASVYNAAGENIGTVALDDALFGIEPNKAVMHQAFVRQQANARHGTHDTKTRGEVRGGGRKPYRQKGTGRARQGSTRAPQWKGGGTVWGPHPRLYTQAMPRKMRHLAIRSALSAKAANVSVLRGLDELEGRTKAMIALLAGLDNPRSTLVIVPERVENLHRAAGNLREVKVLNAGYLNMADLLKYERLLFTVEALNRISELWGDGEYSAEVKESKPAAKAPARRSRAAAATADAEPDASEAEEKETPAKASAAAASEDEETLEATEAKVVETGEEVESPATDDETEEKA
jgi:large subunit ribosomal protein L4